MTTRIAASHRTAPRRLRGVSLVEILVVITTISILVAIVIHAATVVGRGADVAREMSAARSLAMAWSNYATDHRGAVLPGYADGFRARDADGEFVDTQAVPIAARRWPLRLAPYLGHDFAALYSGPNADYLENLAGAPTEDALYAVTVHPSFGLNSVFVGGDENHGGFDPVFQQAFGSFYATRLSTIRNPERLVVFSTSRSDASLPGTTGVIREGFFRVLPPAWASPLWAEDYDPESPQTAGFTSPRHRSNGKEVAIVTTVGGAIETRTIDELRDMRRWSDQADAPDWLLQPLLP